ncbi:hypothetical protein GGF49_004165 [Coemansia sp. RSA 1853]|nr:hypothetical protein GGF49_004165 [Coemansia sp. RSA 1853]
MQSGITLGSLGIQSRGPPSISASHSVVIRTREFDSAASESDGADLAHMPGLWQKATDNSSQPKTDLLRHKDILQCPWNALAMLFFYKWHVLKEPPPDFEDPTWANQPLFHIDPALHDDELEQFCGKIYSEFVDGASRGVQRFKYMSESALDTVTDALTSSKLLRNAVSSAQNMYVTLRSLQNGHCADVQLANAGFRSDNRATTYNVPRQKHTVPQHIEEQIFLFVDTLPSYDDLVDQGGSPEQWDIIVRFCNLLKMLRTVLLQDMAILCDIPFYRRMLLGTAIFSSEVFQSIHFVQTPIAETLVSVEPVGGSPKTDLVFVDLTLDSDGNDEDDDEKGCQAQIQHLTRVENNQILDKSSIVLVDHHAEPAVFPIDQTENLVQKQDQKVDESPDTTTVQTPVSSTVSVDETDQTVSKPLESILTAAELLVTAEIGGQSDAPSESADTTDTLQDSSCTSSGSKSDGRVIQDERLTDESDIRKKAALTDKLLQSIRDISSELSEAVTINQFMQRRISRIATCQKYPDPSTVNGKTSTQPPISRERHQRSLVKLDMVAKRNNYHLKSAVNTAARILEEAEAELQIQPK